MRLLLLLGLLIVPSLASVEPQEVLRHQGSVTIKTREDIGHYLIAVKSTNPDAQWAKVEVFYRTHMSGLKESLLETNVSIVPVAGDRFTPVASLDLTDTKVELIDVSLVREVEYQRFQMTGGSHATK